MKHSMEEARGDPSTVKRKSVAEYEYECCIVSGIIYKDVLLLHQQVITIESSLKISYLFTYKYCKLWPQVQYLKMRLIIIIPLFFSALAIAAPAVEDSDADVVPYDVEGGLKCSICIAVGFLYSFPSFGD